MQLKSITVLLYDFSFNKGGTGPMSNDNRVFLKSKSYLY